MRPRLKKEISKIRRRGVLGGQLPPNTPIAPFQVLFDMYYRHVCEPILIQLSSNR